MMNPRNGCLLLLLLTCFPGLSIAGSYQYHPSSTLHLGGGFDPSDPQRVHLTCIDSDQPEHLEGDAKDSTVKTEFSVSIVSDRKQLYQQLNIDAKLSARYLFASGSASFSLDDQYQFESTDLVWTLKANTDYGRWILKNPRINNVGMTALKQKRFDITCGTEFVHQERRVAQVVAVYSMHNLSESQKTKIQVALSGSASITASAGGDFSAHMNSMLNKAEQSSRININIFAIGGNGITMLASIAEKDKLEDVGTIMKQYIEKISPTNVPAAEYLTGSWEIFGISVFPSDTTHCDLVLQELYFNYADLESEFRKIGEILRASAKDQRTTTDNQKSQIAQLAKDYVTLDTKLVSLITLGRQYLKAKDSDQVCKLTAPIEYKVRWPDQTTELRWDRKDSAGNLYKIEFPVATRNLHGQIYHEFRSLPPSVGDARIYKVEYRCTPGNDRCRFTYDPCDGRGNVAGACYALTPDAKGFTWFRKWDADPVDEYYTAYYEIPRLECVANCPP